MATLTDPGEDTSVEQGSVDAGIDQAEDFANDPGNASPNYVDRLKDRGGNNSSGAGRMGSMAKGIGGFASRNKKGLVGGGIGASIVGLIIGGFLALLPLKIESMMKNIIGARFDRVEHAMEKRAERVFITYALSKAGSGGGTVATGNLAFDALRTKLLRGWEADLKDKHGIEIKQGTRPGHIILSTPSGASPSVGTSEELKRYLDQGELNNRDARRFIKQAARDTTKWHQVYKRKHVRKWMYNAYGVKTWRVFDNKKGDEAETNFDSKSRDAATGEYRNRVGKYIGCMLGDSASCPKKVNPNQPTTPPSDGRTQQARTETEGVAKEIAGDDTGKLVADEISKKVTSSLAGKAVPIIGWVDMASRMDHFLWNDGAGAIIEARNSLQYANVFAFWATVSDDMKEGNASGDEVNVAMQKLDGIENSAAFQDIYMSKDGGVKLTEDQTVNSENSAVVTEHYKKIMAVNHVPLAIYYETVGKIFGKILDIVGGFLSSILAMIPGAETIQGFISKVFIKIFDFAIKPVVFGFEKGAALINAIDAGADVVANTFAEAYGGEKVSARAAAEIDAQIALEAKQDYAQQGLVARLTDTEYRLSYANRIAAVLPSSPEGAASQSGSYLANIYKSPANFFSGIFTNLFKPVSAAGTGRSLAGVQQFAWSEATLSKDLQGPKADVAGTDSEGNPTGPDNKIDGSDCVEGNTDDVALCKLDVLTMEAMGSLYTDEDDGGIGGETAPAPSDGGGTTPITPGNLQFPPNLDNNPNSFGYYRMPASTNGAYQIYACTVRQYGSKELIGTLYTVAQQWRTKYPAGFLYIGDLNAGAPHKSHRWGVGVDLSGTTNGKDRVADFTRSPYNRQGTIELGQMFVDTGLVKNIWYNDATANAAIKAYATSKGISINIKPVSGHDNHFHLDINTARGQEWAPSCR